MRLSFAIATIMAVLIATTLEICMSGAVTRCNSEYGSAKATIMSWVAPRAMACR